MIPIAKPIIENQEINAVTNVLNTANIACGEQVATFEKQFAQYIGTKYAIAVNSGTAALHTALLAINIRPKDEIILPAFTFIATANTILFCNATPKFCDIHPQTFNIDITKIETLITPKTKAILPVHLYGQPAAMHQIQEIAEKHHLHIIGDAAQAHGATYHNKKIGTFGDVECFSFYPTKNMTCGEGGMLTTNNPDIAENAYAIRNHGREKITYTYDHTRIGYNYRMTDIAAAIAIEQLKKLPKFNKKRQENAHYFNTYLDKHKSITIPYVDENVQHVYHQYTIKSPNRQQIIQTLQKNQIGYGIYYPKPLHFYPHLRQFTHTKLKTAEQTTEIVLSLPVHPSISSKDLDKIITTIT